MVYPKLRSQRGITLIETMIGTTLLAVLSVIMLAAGTTFSEVRQEQRERTAAHTNANVVRMRVLGDAASATSALCATAEILSFNLSSGTLVQYHVDEGDLMRWSLPPDKDSLVAEDVTGLSCTSFGPAGLAVGFDLGSAANQFQLYLRVTDSSGAS